MPADVPQTHELLLADYESALGVSTEPDAATTTASCAEPVLAATLPVMTLAAGSVAAYAAAGNRLRRARDLPPMRHTLQPEVVAANFSSPALLRIDDQPVSGFSALSGFFRTVDGWVRTHANYPHHRQRLLDALELPTAAGPDDLAKRIATAHGSDIEDQAAAHHAVAVRVRTESEWAASEPGRAAAEGPIVAVDRRADSHDGELTGLATRLRPMCGLRVLDLTRVLAGPVATRALALLGADVLRIDPPHLPEIEWQHIDTGQGKRSALLDVRADPVAFRELLCAADVLVTGYRPGALLPDPAAIPPGIVHARVSAWGESGPWAHRRGFDSIVQPATGIAMAEGAPGALPAQALDFASGYLLAAGIIDAIVARHADGLGRDVRVSLARTASWLLRAPGRTPDHPTAVLPGSATTLRHNTGLVTAAPVLAEYPDYPWQARPYGKDQPTWGLS